MTQLSDTIIWGCFCECGNECFVLQDKHHPWDCSNFQVSVKCSKCSKLNIINQKIASTYYSHKTLNCFNNISGRILDIGCGHGFLSLNILNSNEAVEKVYMLDSDEKCIDELKKTINNEKIILINENIKNLANVFEGISIDYIICRDVLMFIEDIPLFFKTVSQLSLRGLRFMG